jgi:glycosyltransferase involved in cell wall biosynthesis
MKILYDCTYLRNQYTGVDIYFFNLIKCILSIDQTNHYFILVDSRFETRFLINELKSYSNYQIIKIYSPLPLQILYSSFFIPIFLKIKKINIYHNPYFFGPISKLLCNKTKIIITVHDVYHWAIPEFRNRLFNIIWRVFSDRAVKAADSVIVISNQTKLDVIKYIKIDERKIHLIYQALNSDLEFDESFKIEGRIKKFELTENNYILAVGTLLPSKGYSDLIKSFDLLLKNPLLDNYKLVLVGNDSNSYVSVLKNLIKSLGIKDSSVIITGYIQNDDLIELYKSASLFVCPSYYEGFGLPLLEAMKFGKPIIARDVSSIAEILDNSGLLFSDFNDLHDKIKLVLGDPNLSNIMKTNGYKRLKDFSWHQTAIKTLKLYL